MKIDFSKIQFKDLHGKMYVHDLSEELGQTMYQKTQNELELDLARKIADKKEVELSKAEAGVVKKFITEFFMAFVKEAVIPALDVIINYKEEPKQIKK